MDYLLNNVERLFPKQQSHQVKGQILKVLKSCELMRKVAVMGVVMLEREEGYYLKVPVMMRVKNLAGQDLAVDLVVGLDQLVDQDLDHGQGQEVDLDLKVDQGQGQNLGVDQDRGQNLEVDLGLDLVQDQKASLLPDQEVDHQLIQVVDLQVDLEVLHLLVQGVYHQLDQEVGHQVAVVEAAGEDQQRKTVTEIIDNLHLYSSNLK